MSDFAIRVEGLSKRYQIGQREPYKALRDVLAGAASAPFRRLRAGTQGGERGASPQEGTFWALKDVSFEVKQGEAVGIIGRNGAGKSTLLKVLSRITKPTEGYAELHGRVGSLLEVGTGFHPELTGRENVFLNGAILGMRRAEIARKFDEIVAFAEIEQFLDTPVKRYSSGMYVRLAFAVAAHLEPEILLVDEVLAVGDAAFQKKCLGKVGDLTAQGRTVLFVSHHMAAMLALCSRSLLIEAGGIVHDGRSQDVVQGYLNRSQVVSARKDLRGRLDRHGDGSMRAVDLCFGTLADRTSGFWITGQDCLVHISYECTGSRAYRNIEVALGITQLDHTRLLYLGTRVVHQDVECARDSGSSTCTIKRLPLEPGRYPITVELKQNGIIADHVEAAATVDVADGDYYGTGRIWPYGGLLCDYSWSHETGRRDAPGR